MLEARASVDDLVVSMRMVVKERQKHLGLPRKITWAFYSKDSFESLIDNLVTTTNDVVKIFPSSKPRADYGDMMEYLLTMPPTSLETRLERRRPLFPMSIDSTIRVSE